MLSDSQSAVLFFFLLAFCSSRSPTFSPAAVLRGFVNYLVALKEKKQTFKIGSLCRMIDVGGGEQLCNKQNNV